MRQLWPAGVRTSNRPCSTSRVCLRLDGCCRAIVLTVAGLLHALPLSCSHILANRWPGGPARFGRDQQVHTRTLERSLRSCTDRRCRAVPCPAVPCRAVPWRALPCVAVPCRRARRHKSAPVVNGITFNPIFGSTRETAELTLNL